METTRQNPIEQMGKIENQYLVNHVNSGLPRWLIEAAFVSYLLQAVVSWTDVSLWMEGHRLAWLSGIVRTFGSMVMYIGLMRGMKSLYRPFTVWWWLVIVLNFAGFLTDSIPSISDSVGLPVAVSLMLVYLPLGSAIAFNYRGRLRQVGIWMVLYILISSLLPVVVVLLFEPDQLWAYLLLEIFTVVAIVVFAWMQRRVLI